MFFKNHVQTFVNIVVAIGSLDKVEDDDGRLEIVMEIAGNNLNQGNLCKKRNYH